MIKSRKIIIENAVKKVFGDQIKLNFSNKKINITNSAKSQKEEIKSPNENNPRQSTNYQPSNNPSKNPQKESYDDSSKNLANFLTGKLSI